ncbi:MAG: SCP2 sterol-binding domain-containing protein [Cyclobacteriaceae bacterium]
MTLEEVTQKVAELAITHSGKIGSTVKFSFEDGTVIYLDDTTNPAAVSNADDSANCTVKISKENFLKLMDGEMNAMGAYMMGRMKIDGDMTVAMKLANMF